jgi:hypothetical protein
MKKLYPAPEQASFTKGRFMVGTSTAWHSEFASAPIARTLDERFVQGDRSAAIRILQRPMSREAYSLSVTEQGVQITAADASGALYGVFLLMQLFDAKTRSIPFCTIQDRPKLALRGVMLDISRNKIPTLRTLLELLPTLAKFRINHLQLYVEGFAMESKTFPHVHRAYRPFLIEEFQALEEAAREYGIELVGNQNSFGHLTEWLRLPEFHPLAECPDGFVQWGYPFPASTINPTDPESLTFVKRLLDGFVPHTRSEWFNLNGDEPFELGRGKSKAAVEEAGVGAVYWAFVAKLIEHLRTHGKHAMLWGDVLIHHPELMDRIPRDAVFLDWGYDRGYPFAEHARLLEAKRVGFVTCPGTSTWNSFAGRHRDMWTTTNDAARAAIDHGGLGVMTTDWGDFGHLQYLPASFWGFATLGMAAWSGFAAEATIRTYLDDHVFVAKRGSPASLWYDLANIQNLEPNFVYNGTVMFRSIQFVATDPIPLSMKAEVHRQALSQMPIPESSAKAIREALSKIRRRIRLLEGECEGFDLMKREMLQTARFLKIALETNRIVTDPACDTPRRRASTLREIETAAREHGMLWRNRNLESTFEQSLFRVRELGRILALRDGNML